MARSSYDEGTGRVRVRKNKKRPPFETAADKSAKAAAQRITPAPGSA
jgi:hypothetical protein